jgi:hypothetical protein
MIINAYQMDMMKNLVYNDFIQRMVKRAKKYNPDLILEMEDNELTTLVRYYSDTAVRFGINNEKNIEKYIDLCFGNPELNMQPMPQWIIDILSFPDMPEEMKINKLSMYLNFGSLESEEYKTETISENEFLFDSTIV